MKKGRGGEIEREKENETDKGKAIYTHVCIGHTEISERWFRKKLRYKLR